MSESITTTPRRRTFGWVGLVIAVLFGLLFAYDLWEAIGNAIELPKFFAQLEEVGLGAREVPWVLIWVGILIPPIAYAAALVLGLRRTAPLKALIFLVALVAVATLSMSVNALATVSREPRHPRPYKATRTSRTIRTT